jgi:hypothetical protein
VHYLGVYCNAGSFTILLSRQINCAQSQRMLGHPINGCNTQDDDKRNNVLLVISVTFQLS